MLGYTVALGLPELRAASPRTTATPTACRSPRDDVVVTTGSSGGFLLAFLAAFDVGDRVAMARPGYPCYRNILTALGCEVVELPCGPETRFQPTVAMLEDLDGIDGLIVASPANPTGTMLPPDELAALAAYCERAGIQLISDEIYHGISYAGRPRDVLRLGDLARGGRLQLLLQVLLDDRLAARLAARPRAAAPRRRRLTGNFTICPPALAQHAAVAAFTPEGYAEADGHVARYAANRALLLDGLGRLGIDRLAPADGAFYVYADVAHLTDDSMAWTYRLLAETGVALAPGVDFDPVDGHRWVRFSFAGAADDVGGALDRLERWLRPAVMEDEPRIAAWDAKVDWPLTGLTLVFLAGYAWQVLDTSLGPAAREAAGPRAHRDLAVAGPGLPGPARGSPGASSASSAGTCWTC